ncbi:MAG TPA: hypothetical protein VFK03_04495 [Candidatus Saccharimonadales bacterium]|nr:hypothetical protein [Candidatus Saccharimonadales bacterium]
MEAILDKVVGSRTWHRALDSRDLQGFVARHEQALESVEDEELNDAAFELGDLVE